MESPNEITLPSGIIIKKSSVTHTEPVANDIFSDFSLPSLIRPIIDENKQSLLSQLCPMLELSSILNKLQTKDFTLVIPAELRNAVNDGLAYLGKSARHPGGMTPNIYDSETGKLLGQGYVFSEPAPQAMGDVMNNVAIFMMLQDVTEQLDSIQKDISFIKEGLLNSYMGKVIGSFKSYVVALPTFRTIEEQRNASFVVYCSICEGLHQIHFFLDMMCKQLSESPDNWVKHLFQAAKHLTKNVVGEYERLYRELVSHLYNFHNLMILSDLILLHRGASFSVIQESHKSVNAFYSRALNDELDKRIAYLTNDNYEAYKKIKTITTEEEANLKEVLISIEECKTLEIPYNAEEIEKFLTNGRGKEI